MYSEHKNKGKITDWRITIFMVVFPLLLLVILSKLFSIQIVNTGRYQIAAKKQYESRISLKPSRGFIFDRRMNGLVTNVNMFSFAADPNMMDDRDSAASVFASIFGKDKNYYLERLNAKNTSFVWLERRVDPGYESKVQGLNISGVIKLNEPQRVLSYDKLASGIIGATDIDNNGISGIEYECNEILSGREGYIVMQKDGLGRKRPAVEYPRMEPANGNNIVLTIDMNIQKVIEEELEKGVKVNDAEGGKCIVMSVRTGEVLGIASLSMNANGNNRLSVITDLYEPGSTFKIVTASASLEEGLENKYDIIQTYGGEYQFNGLKLKDSYSNTSMTFQQVIEQSSNIGVSQVAVKLGPKRFYKYARDFGFGVTTGIELPGEMSGSLKRPFEFSPVSLRYMSIGYEVLVNTLQMTAAYACIANDGRLMKPFIIKKEVTPEGTVVKENRPTLIRTVISRNTARTLTELLYGVVEKGTGREARVENVMVAGKTGTSQKIVEGKYSKKSYTSSFIGYFPANAPEIVVTVIIDAPKSGEYYGGKVAAPIFKRITERILSVTDFREYLLTANNIEDRGFVKQVTSSVEGPENRPLNLTGLQVGDAMKLLNEKNIDFEVEGPQKNSVVCGQEYSESGKVKLICRKNSTAPGPDDPERLRRMPDLRGMSLRKCITALSEIGVDMKISGRGKVVSQKPEPGSLLVKQQPVVINCDNSSSSE